MLLALDFDGVLCDSASETASSAWNCAYKLWPDELKQKEIPEEIRDGFLKARPCLETGYQAVIMIKMLLEKLPFSAFQNDLQEHCERIMQEKKVNKEYLIDLFGSTRDKWIKNDLQGWLKSHRFFPGTIDTFKEACQKFDVYILTTKQERYVSLLLEGEGVNFPAEKIFGLEKKISKEKSLENFIANGTEKIAFVEDRYETLQRVVAIPELMKKTKLFYALWGYGTEAERNEREKQKAIKAIGLQDFNCEFFEKQ